MSYDNYDIEMLRRILDEKEEQFNQRQQGHGGNYKAEVNDSKLISLRHEIDEIESALSKKFGATKPKKKGWF